MGAEGRLESGVRRSALDPVAAQALEELRAGGGAVDDCLVEVLADHVHALAEGPTLDAICASAGCALAVGDVRPGAHAQLYPWGMVLVRRHHDPAHTRVVALHEVAHWVLSRSGLRHVHVDVWRLTLALGAPRAAVERLRRAGGLGAVSLAAETGLPAWAAEARLTNFA